MFVNTLQKEKLHFLSCYPLNPLITEGQVTFPLLLPQPPLIMEGQVTFPFMLQHPLIMEGQVKVKPHCLSVGQIWPHMLVANISPIYVCLSVTTWQMLVQIPSVCLLLVFVTDRQMENYRGGQS